jgi:hypothetical protein
MKTISPIEANKRIKAVKYVVATNKLEGLDISEEAKTQFDAYVTGSATSSEVVSVLIENAHKEAANGKE